MATCGYLCPECEGKGFKEDGTNCDWCQSDINVQKKDPEKDLEEWIQKVHQGPCCSDVENREELL